MDDTEHHIADLERRVAELAAELENFRAGLAEEIHTGHLVVNDGGGAITEVNMEGLFVTDRDHGTEIAPGNVTVCNLTTGTAKRLEVDDNARIRIGRIR